MSQRQDPDGRRLPVKLDSTSNGEFTPIPLEPVHHEANALALAAATRNARGQGVSRRDFMVSACGAATALLAMNAAYAAAGKRGGHYALPPEAAMEPAAAEARAAVAMLPDLAVILLDVVMETDDAGLQLVRHVRQDLKREAVRIIHLDHPLDTAARVVTRTPADILKRPDHGRIAVGGKADLVLFSARRWSEFLSRPQADRIVMRNGMGIDRSLPDYRELDPVLGA